MRGSENVTENTKTNKPVRFRGITQKLRQPTDSKRNIGPSTLGNPKKRTNETLKMARRGRLVFRPRTEILEGGGSCSVSGDVAGRKKLGTNFFDVASLIHIGKRFGPATSNIKRDKMMEFDILGDFKLRGKTRDEGVHKIIGTNDGQFINMKRNQTNKLAVVETKIQSWVIGILLKTQGKEGYMEFGVPLERRLIEAIERLFRPSRDV